MNIQAILDAQAAFNVRFCNCRIVNVRPRDDFTFRWPDDIRIRVEAPKPTGGKG